MLDGNKKPVLGARLGKATVPAGGKREEFALARAEGNSVAGKLVGPVSGKVTVVLQLTAGGKPAMVRLAVG